MGADMNVAFEERLRVAQEAQQKRHEEQLKKARSATEVLKKEVQALRSEAQAAVKAKRKEGSWASPKREAKATKGAGAEEGPGKGNA